MNSRTIEALKSGVRLELFYQPTANAIVIRGHFAEWEWTRMVNAVEQVQCQFDIVELECERVATELERVARAEQAAKGTTVC